MWCKALLAIAVSCIVTLYVIPVLLKVALKMGAIDAPDGRIKVHAQPTPYLGGLGIYIGFMAALAIVFPFGSNFFLFLVGCTLLLFLGLVDDLCPLTPLQKIIGQSVAVCCFLKAGVYLKEGFFHHTWGIPLSFIWMLGVINAFNLVDVMDGITTTITFFITLFFMAYAYYSGASVVFLFLACFLGTLPAFFWYNKPKARIYLGDSGSLFIGGLMAITPFLLEWRMFSELGIVAPFLILGIPLFEIGSLILIRSYLKIPFYRGSPHHFCLFLKAKGWSVPSILLLVAFFSLLLGALALGVAFGALNIASLSWLLFLSFFAWVVLIFTNVLRIK